MAIEKRLKLPWIIRYNLNVQGNFIQFLLLRITAIIRINAKNYQVLWILFCVYPLKRAFTFKLLRLIDKKLQCLCLSITDKN